MAGRSTASRQVEAKECGNVTKKRHVQYRSLTNLHLHISEMRIASESFARLRSIKSNVPDATAIYD